MSRRIKNPIKHRRKNKSKSVFFDGTRAAYKPDENGKEHSANGKPRRGTTASTASTKSASAFVDASGHSTAESKRVTERVGAAMRARSARAWRFLRSLRLRRPRKHTPAREKRRTKSATSRLSAAAEANTPAAAELEAMVEERERKRGRSVGDKPGQIADKTVPVRTKSGAELMPVD